MYSPRLKLIVALRLLYCSENTKFQHNLWSMQFIFYYEFWYTDFVPKTKCNSYVRRREYCFALNYLYAQTKILDNPFYFTYSCTQHFGGKFELFPFVSNWRSGATYLVIEKKNSWILQLWTLTIPPLSNQKLAQLYDFLINYYMFLTDIHVLFVVKHVGMLLLNVLWRWGL